ALADVARPMPISIPYPSAPSVTSASRSEGLDTERRPAQTAQTAQVVQAAPQGGGNTLNRFLMTVVVLLVIVAVGVGAWTIGRSLGSPENREAQPTPAAPATTQPVQVQEVKAEEATGFDPLGDKEEKAELAALTIDGKPSTFWKTDNYNSA